MTKDLKICVYNLENFFIFISKYKGDKDLHEYGEQDWQLLSSSIYINKDLKSVISIAEIIEREKIDILLLTEVGGLESLENFNKYFLDNKFTPFFLTGNSDRGIDLAYMVRTDLGYDCEIKSHKKHPLNFLYPHEKSNPRNTRKTHFFSRDVLELSLSKDKKLKMKFLLVHLKSKLDKKCVDPDGYLRRQAEAKGLVKIYNGLQAKHPDIPIFIGGDFNGGASLESTSSEFNVIYEKTKLSDVLDICKIEPKFTHIYIEFHSRKVFYNQIDFLFVDKKFSDLVLKADVYRYDAEIGSNLDPETLSGKKRDFPSDHFPLLCKFKVL
jgi:hypothetical protein